MAAKLLLREVNQMNCNVDEVGNRNIKTGPQKKCNDEQIVGLFGFGLDVRQSMTRRDPLLCAGIS